MKPRAGIDVTIDALPDMLRIFPMLGVEVVGSLDSTTGFIVRLLIESDVLPVACLDGLKLVRAAMRQEKSLGRIEIVIDRFEVIKSLQLEAA